MKVLNRIFGKSVQNLPPSPLRPSESDQPPGEVQERRRDKQLLAHDTICMDDAAEILQMNRDKLRIDMGLPREMAHKSIQLGDTVHNHYVQTSTPRNGLGTIGKVALGAGLLATGAGAGIGGALLASALMKAPGVVKEVERWGSRIGIEVIPPEKQP